MKDGGKLKLVFIGNSGSGKTTLAERVALAQNLPMHYTGISKLPTPNVSTDVFSSLITKQTVIRDQIFDTIFNTEEGCYDRSLFDNYCYSQRFLGQNLSLRAPTTHYFNDLRTATAHLKWIKQLLLRREEREVTHYFYCDNIEDYVRKNGIVEEFVSDKKRYGKNDLTLQLIYDTMRRILLPLSKMTFVPSMGLEERVDFCNNVIEGLK